MNKSKKPSNATGPTTQAKIAAAAYNITGNKRHKIKIRKYLKGMNLINISSLFPPL